MTELSKKQQYLILIATSLGVLMNPLLASMLILALPNIGAEFLVSARDLGWMSTAYILANAICLVPGAWVVDKVGYKKSFIAGTGIVSVTCLLSVFASSYASLLTWRVLSGIGVSLLMITSLAILTRIFPKEKRGFVIGINTTMVYVGLTLGPFLGGILTETLGWHSIFLLMAPVVLLSGIMLFICMKTEFTIPVQKFDMWGAVLYAVSMFALMYGLSTITDTGSIFLAAAGLILFAVFIWYETRQAHPLLHVRLFFENKRFARSSYAALLNYAAVYAVTYMVSLYLQSIGQLNAAEAGMIMLFQPLIQVVATPLAGKISDKIDAKYLVTAGMILTIVGLLILSGLGISMTNVAGYIMITQVFIGLGAALFSAPNTSTIMGSVAPSEYSMASSVVSVVRQAGMLISMAVCMAAISLFVGGTDMLGPSMYAQFVEALRVSMLISTGLAVVGVFFSWFRGNVPELK
ncbi:MAG: MFS transporter [Methanocorpusculum parvum]|nr:MFS transporter [Methanocorpusculum parvum]